MRLDADNLELSFGTKRLFRNLSFDVRPGSLLGVIGPSGCGKTTIGKIVCGMLESTGGNVAVDGEDVSDLKDTEQAIMNWQHPVLLDHLSVIENIQLGLKVRRSATDSERFSVGTLIESLGLSDLTLERPTSLSGGEMARAALARTLAIMPKAAVFDEPFANLDVVARDTAMTLIRELLLETGSAGLLVSHSLADIADMCDDVVVIDRIEPLHQYPVSKLIEQPRSAFEAHFTGQWKVNSGNVVEVLGRELVCKSGEGSIKVEIPPWLDEFSPAKNDPIAIAKRQNFQAFNNTGVEGSNEQAIALHA